MNALNYSKILIYFSIHIISEACCLFLLQNVENIHTVNYESVHPVSFRMLSDENPINCLDYLAANQNFN